MKVEYMEFDPDDEDIPSCDVKVVLKDFDENERQFFETLINKSGVTTYTLDNPLDWIVIEGDMFSQITLVFGDVGHIHLKGDALKKFMGGINKVYEKITLGKESNLYR